MKKSKQKILCIPDFNVNDDYGCLEHNKVSKEDLLELSGGIPIHDDFPLKCTIQSSSQYHVRVEITSSIYRCERGFDFGTRIIRNDHLRVLAPGNGIGRILFANQLLAARRLNFKTIKLHAMGGDTGSDWNGFYTWARFGFMMEAGDQLAFEITMENEMRGEKTLNELLSTNEGRAFWIKNGVSWAGKFNIEPSSENSKIFNDYLFEKGLDTL